MSLMLVVNAIMVMLSVNVFHAVGQGNPDQEYENAMDDARRLLKEPIGTPPVPPDINLKCAEGIALKRLGGVFYTRVVQPEEEVCQRLLSAAKQLRFGSADAEEKAGDAMVTAGLVYKRNFRKVDALFRAFKPSPEKFGAVAYASLQVCKNAQLLGVEENSLGEYAGLIGSWANTIAENYLKELQNNHDYRIISAFINLKRIIQLLGANVSETTDLNDLAAALVFNADFDVSRWVSAGSQRVTLKASVELTPDATLKKHGLPRNLASDSRLPDRR